MNAESLVHRVLLLAVLCVVAATVACGDDDDPSPNPGETHQASGHDGEHAGAWVEAVLERVEADGLSPPVASRILGYTGIALYESAVDTMPGHRSLGGQLRGLEEMPVADADEVYDVVTVIDAAVGHLVPMLFADETSREELVGIAESRLATRYADGDVSFEVWERSQVRGVLIAEVLATRIHSDGYRSRNDEEFEAPDVDGAWVPTSDADPLEPHWESLEPLVLEEADFCQPQPPVDYSTSEDSAFYQQARAVVDATPVQGSEEEEIARFWADDPGETATPPGHWMALAGQMIDDRQLNLAQTVELFAAVGIAVNDAFISCWDEKYRSYLLRPETYIQNQIDDEWQPTIDAPPFPEYTSGHSNVSGAASTVMTQILGEFSFEDRTHVDRGKSARSFESFEEAAREAGQSRIYGGIHYPMANEAGLDQGRCVAEAVLEGVEFRVDGE